MRFRYQCHPQKGWTAVSDHDSYECLGPCPRHIPQSGVAKNKAFAVPQTYGDKSVAKNDRQAILLRVVMKIQKQGKNGWLAAVKFAKPLPEQVSFTSPEVVAKYMSPDRRLVTFEPKPWKLADKDLSKKASTVFKVTIDGISVNSHIDKSKMEVYYVPSENLSGWTKGADLSCKLALSNTDSDGICTKMAVSSFDKSSSSGLLQLPLEAPYQGKWKLNLKFKGITAAGLLTTIPGILLNNEIKYNGWTQKNNQAVYEAFGNDNFCWNEAVSFQLDSTSLPTGYNWADNVDAEICFDIDEYPEIATTTTTTTSTTTTTTGSSLTSSGPTSSPATTTSTTTAAEQAELTCYTLTEDQYTIVQNNYWNLWQNGEISHHVLQHGWIIPISENVFDWRLKIDYGYLASNLESWETSVISSIPAGTEKANLWQIDGITGWGTGTEVKTNYQLEVHVNDFNKIIAVELFFPIKVEICLPYGVVPGQAVTTSTSKVSSTATTAVTTTSYTGPSTTFALTTKTEPVDFDCSSSTGAIAESPTQTKTQSADETSSPNYSSALSKSILFYEAQMSGPLPSWHRIPWRGDSGLNDGCDVGHDLTGGFHDAGDFVKFHFPQSFALNVLAWGMTEFKAGYQAAGEFENGLRILRWGIDHFKKCHANSHPDFPNVFYAQVGDGNTDHAWWGRPEEMQMERPSMAITPKNPGSEMAAGASAAFSSAALVFGAHYGWDDEYALDCLSRARQLLEFATEHRENYHQSVPDAAQFYKSWSGYNDEIVLAGAWIAKASQKLEPSSFAGDVAKAVGLYNTFGIGSGGEFSWDSKEAGAQLLMYQLTNEAKYKAQFDQFKQSILRKPTTPAGMWFIQQWGSVRHAANAAFLFALDGDTKTAQSQIDYILGFGAGKTPKVDGKRGTYQVGYGRNSPTMPHHKAASCPAPPAACTWDNFKSASENPWTLYGAIIGGPDSATDSFSNDRSNYVTNEVALDYNAGFQGVLAALLG